MEGGLVENPSTLHNLNQGGLHMKSYLALFFAALFLSAASLAAAKDYQVTGPVVDVKDDAIIVKKGNENWEIARDKNTKTTGDVKKGDKVMIKYKMTATSIESKEPAKKTEAKPMGKSDAKPATEPKTEAKTK
jgi:hypothetical protein